jgi:serine protease
MRSILGLGLLLLMAGCDCLFDENCGAGGDTGGGAGLPLKARVQGQLTPFRSAGQSTGSGHTRPALLDEIGVERLRELTRRAHPGGSLLPQRLGVLPSGMPLLLPAGGVEAVARTPLGSPVIAGEVIVRFEDRNLSSDEVLRRVATRGYSAVYKSAVSEHAHLVSFYREGVQAMSVALSVQETASMVSSLSTRPGVRYAEPNLRMHHFATPDDRAFTAQWHYPMLKLEAAWDETKGADSVVVAVLDTGIRNHPDLQARVIPGYDMISDAANGGDGNGRDNNPNDEGGDEPQGGSSWHGTHVAGTIGAVTNNATGVAGVTWNGKILPVRVLGRQGGSSADIAAGIRWAAGADVTGVPTNTTPAKVLNLSLGGQAPPQRIYQEAIDAARDKGAIIVIAAGNSTADAINFTPCNQQNVICVGSVGFSGKRSSFSNYGAPVDFMATGGEMREDLNGDQYPDGVLSTYFDEQGNPSYGFEQGTSMASPHVAGVVALMAAVKPTLSQAEAESVLKSTAVAANQCAEGCGSGLVNALAAVKQIKGGGTNDPPRLSVTSGNKLSFVLNEGQSATQRILVSNLGGGSLSVTAQAAGAQASKVSFPKGNSVQAAAFGSAELEVAVTSAGLARGNYTATINLTAGAAGSAQVQVEINVGTQQQGKDAVIAFAYLDAREEWQVDNDGVAVVRAANNYQYQHSLTPRTYYVLATIDEDGDQQFFEEGEPVGAWRNMDQFEPVDMKRGITLSDINFDLIPMRPLPGDGTPSKQPIGGACRSGADCQSNVCDTSVTGGYCTQDCSNAACPSGSTCVILNQTTRMCLANCTGSGQSTCRTGYVCTPLQGGGGVCFPP